MKTVDRYVIQHPDNQDLFAGVRDGFTWVQFSSATIYTNRRSAAGSVGHRRYHGRIKNVTVSLGFVVSQGNSSIDANIAGCPTLIQETA